MLPPKSKEKTPVNLHGDLELEQPASKLNRKCFQIVPVAQVTRVREVSVENALTRARLVPRPVHASGVYSCSVSEQRGGSQGRRSGEQKTEAERGRNA